MITKFIPEKLTRAVGRASLQASKNSPKYLFVGGVVGVVGATVLACKATLKVEDVLVEHQKIMLDIKTVQHATYSEQDRQHDRTLLFVKTTVTLVKLYGPAIILGSLSIAAITKSHTILTERNAALSAAYAGLDATFGQYRDRVRKALGDDEEEKIYRDARTTVEKIDGQKVKTSVGGGNGGIYSELYSADTTHNFHVGSHEANIMTLRQRENYLNDRLRMRGHLYLNEALEELGFDHTEEGSVVGWLWKPEDTSHSGYSFVSLGCWGDDERTSINPLMMNSEDGIFLDFNVVGEIYRRLDEVKPIWKLTDKAQRKLGRS